MAGVFDFTATSLTGDEVPLKQFEGKVLLIVNTASACGFTPQYKGLEALQQALAPRGFSVLGFPCNQFGGQEPGDARQIEQFWSSNYAVTFPMFAKVDVNGGNAHPLYQYLKNANRGCLAPRSNGISPNFWSIAPARWWRGTHRPRSPKGSQRKSRHYCEREE